MLGSRSGSFSFSLTDVICSLATKGLIMYTKNGIRVKWGRCLIWTADQKPFQFKLHSRPAIETASFSNCSRLSRGDNREDYSQAEEKGKRTCYTEKPKPQQSQACTLNSCPSYCLGQSRKQYADHIILSLIEKNNLLLAITNHNENKHGIIDCALT